MIKKATEEELDIVLEITHTTISEIYSHYYAPGVVDFFLEHHSRQNVLDDIKNGIVYLLEVDGCLVATITIKENAINRLFVLPKYQSHGYGSRLMDFAESLIAENFSQIHIDSSLAAKELYLKRGYKEKRTCKITAENEDVLVYDEMEKQVARQHKEMIEEAHMKIEHVAMYVNDLEAARAFFIKYLGAVSNDGYHNKTTDFRSYFLTFDDGARLEIMHKPSMEDAEKTLTRTGYIHIAFSVGSKEKVDEITEVLKRDGYEVVSGPRTTGDGYYESCIVGIEGNQIEITV